MNHLQTAFLLAHAINTLGAQTDEDWVDRCCWHECAPCSVIYELLRDETLTATVRPYLIHGGGDWSWWTGSPQHGQVNRAWFLARLCSPSRCEQRWRVHARCTDACSFDSCGACGTTWCKEHETHQCATGKILSNNLFTE